MVTTCRGILDWRRARL